MPKKALITGITGQDGSYLAELLLGKGYEVYGIIRRSSTFNTDRIDHIFKDPHIKDDNRLHLVFGDMNDASSINKILRNVEPEEVYNLAAQSHVRVSFDIPEYTSEITAIGALRVLEAIKELRLKSKFYQASSSEMFGASPPPQNEDTIFYPRSPYAVAKMYAHWMTKHYREAYNMFNCCGILFNHESPRRGETFVTRKITKGLAEIVAGKAEKVYLGNMDAKRDWGFAGDYVEAMWMMMQHDKPDDYVIATGESHSVREFIEEACLYAGLGDYNKYVEKDMKYFRPTEVEALCGDPGKAKRVLGWEPKVKFKDLVHMMVDADLKELGVKN